MKLHASSPGAANVVNAYGEGYVMVNGERRASSVVVLPDRTIVQLVDVRDPFNVSLAWNKGRVTTTLYANHIGPTPNYYARLNPADAVRAHWVESRAEGPGAGVPPRMGDAGTARGAGAATPPLSQAPFVPVHRYTQSASFYQQQQSTRPTGGYVQRYQSTNIP